MTALPTSPAARCGWGRIGNGQWERIGGECEKPAPFDMHPYQIAQHIRVCADCLAFTIALTSDAIGVPVFIVEMVQR